jgi:hypothetical protein
VFAHFETHQWPGGPAEISRWRKPPDPPQHGMRPEGCAGNLPVSTAASGADSVFGREPVACATGSYDLSEIRRLGIRAENAGWRDWGSARASRAVFRALAEYTRRPKAFRMPVDARCAARGARHGTRGARAPHARRSASHSSR